MKRAALACLLFLAACPSQPGDGPSAAVVRELGALCSTYAAALNTAANFNRAGSLTPSQVVIVDEVVASVGPTCEATAVPTRASEIDLAIAAVRAGIARLIPVTGAPS